MYLKSNVSELVMLDGSIHLLGFLYQQKDGLRNNVLLITGQAGVGKSATIHLIGSILGVTVYEWNAPIPTIWQEHVHNSSSGT